MTTRAIQITELITPVIDPTTASIADGYTVEFYEAGTSNAKNVWTEPAKTNAYTSVTLGDGSWESGTAQVYGDGNYKITIKNADSATVLEWDNVKVVANNFSVVTKTGNYTVTPDDDVILVDTSGGNITISLQTVDNFIHPVTIKKIHASNAVTIDPNAAETIDGDSTLTITVLNESVTINPDTNASMWRRDLQAATDVRIDNDSYILSDNNAGDGTVNVVKATTDDRIEFGVAIETPQFHDGTNTIDFPTNNMAAAKFMLGNSSTIAWFYLNAAPPGWKTLATGADSVLGISGGSGDYNVNGGNPDSSATWVVAGLTKDAHTHAAGTLAADADAGTPEDEGTGANTCSPTGHTHTISGNTGAQSDAGITSDGTWRPKASVGKLFQLDTA